MLDLLDNLPRLRLSDDHLKSIIWVMRECKTPNVPSFAALRKKQESLARDIGINSEHHTSSLGNHFYMNHPAKLFALVHISLSNLLARIDTSIHRTGQIPLFGHSYIYILSFRVQYRNFGSLRSGQSKQILTIFLLCGPIGRTSPSLTVIII
jgi:hypothetical protein